ncbi:MarR family winged helix-turn-helix transcriptional regulator [Rhodopirellula sallentina]|uniref:MarR family transcriptional regulator n=1 Tax=Rhodopirellula sallentina SM41 TaxID=1263870 RepID=M5TWB7_9BACT|nr:MarR family winged helix-turn-helix transcriptional regulator [Rhodopirellula sallentina]EMI53329.1 MarR family transcriptional regulator [Rhodopirellula sallentina SM41]
MNNMSLSEVVHQLMHSYKKQLHDGIENEGILLPVNHIRTLKCIERVPECTARTVAQRMNQDKAQTTRVLNDLTQSGFIQKTENPNDGRSQFLVLTKTGKQLLTKINRVEKQAAAQLTKDLSPKEVEAFVRIATVMIESVRVPAAS